MKKITFLFMVLAIGLLSCNNVEKTNTKQTNESNIKMPTIEEAGKKEITQATENEVLNDSWKSIRLSGTEPFWSLHFDDEYALFTPNVGEETLQIKYESIKAQDNSMQITGMCGNENIIIAIVKETCSDGMSDNTYPYSAEIKTASGKTWIGCGMDMEFALKSNYIDLPEKQASELKELLQTNNLEVINKKSFDEMTAYFNRTVLGSGGDGPSGDGNLTGRYFWFIYNALPDFVDKQERHRGYYTDENKQDASDKLLAYSIYRIDRSPENIRKLFNYLKPIMKKLVPPATFEHYFYNQMIHAMLIGYERITETTNYKENLLACYAMVDTLTGTFTNEEGNMVYSSNIGAYGFDAYSLNEYISRHLTYKETHDPYADISWYSFWMRRCAEGNMEEVYAILKEIEELYKQ